MAVLQLKSFDQLLQSLISFTVVRAGLTDLNDSSMGKHLLAAFAREGAEIYYQLGLIPDMFSLDSASGEDLDARAEDMQPSGIVREGATKATGTIVLSRGGSSGVVNVPAGTVFKDPVSGQRVATTALGTIDNGDTASPPVNAVAVEAGSAGNINAGPLRFESRPAGVDAVTAATAFQGGTDQETDDALRKRLKDYVRSLARSVPTALQFIAVGTTIENGKRVIFAHVVEDMENRGEVTLYIDDGAGTAESSDNVVDELVSEGMGGPGGDTAVGGEVFLYLNEGPVKPGAPFVLESDINGTLVEDTDFLLNRSAYVPQIKLIGANYATGAANGEEFTASYTTMTGLVREVQRKVDGDESDRVNYPGWRAAGVRVTVASPSVLQLLVEATILVAEGFTEETVKSEVQNAMSEYVNGLGISGDVIVAELITAAMQVEGVINVLVSNPSEDVIIQDDEIPRLTVANVVL